MSAMECDADEEMKMDSAILPPPAATPFSFSPSPSFSPFSQSFQPFSSFPSPAFSPVETKDCGYKYRLVVRINGKRMGCRIDTPNKEVARVWTEALLQERLFPHLSEEEFEELVYHSLPHELNDEERIQQKHAIDAMDSIDIAEYNPVHLGVLTNVWTALD